MTNFDGLTDSELEELRADLEPMIGRSVEAEDREALEDALHEALQDAPDGDDLRELLDLYGLEVDHDGDGEPEDRVEDLEDHKIARMNDKLRNDLATAYNQEDYNALGTVLAEILETPTPSAKETRLATARAILEGRIGYTATPEDADAFEGSIFILHGDPDDDPSIFSGDILIDPEEELEAKIRKGIMHRELELEEAVQMHRAGDGTINRFRSNLPDDLEL